MIRLNIFKKDADTLYFNLVELPNPRNTAVFTISHGNKVIATSHLSLDEKGVETACRVVDFHRGTIKRCAYKNIAYQNVTDWAKSKLEAVLAKPD